VSFARSRRLDGTGRLLLHPDGEVIGPSDRGRGILLLDSSWRKLPELLATIDGDPARRRLPALTTAYPRKSSVFADPAQGLASVEALYAALALLGTPHPELLEGYRWAENFLAANPILSAPGSPPITS
jgi:pre-rRNA-processing protein TSR3